MSRISDLNNFVKKNELLLCIDSDGCVMDTMTIKHEKCFGPALIEEWNLHEFEDDILKKWNDINLYTENRGINRFKGLYLALVYINLNFQDIEDLDKFKEWLENSTEHSNESLIKKISESENKCLKKVLNWSISVNKKVSSLSDEELIPFDNIKEKINIAHKTCDIAVVSSANYDAIDSEWSKHKLKEDIDIILAQDIGSKSYCISKLLEKGYKRNNVIMIGDSLGDMNAAMDNLVHFYPILVGKESISWDKFYKALDNLTNENYTEEYQEQLNKEFIQNLKN